MVGVSFFSIEVTHEEEASLTANLKLVIATTALLASANSIVAHHSFPAEFDLAKPIHIEGKVTRVLWRNPHVEVTLNVKNTQGVTEEWRVEVSGASILHLLGWEKDTVASGMDVGVGGYSAKSGERKVGSTVFSVRSIQRGFKTPACWWPSGTVTLADIQNSNCPIPEVP